MDLPCWEAEEARSRLNKICDLRSRQVKKICDLGNSFGTSTAFQPNQYRALLVNVGREFAAIDTAQILE